MKYFFKIEQRSILVDNDFQYRFVVLYPYGDSGQLKSKGFGEWTTYNNARFQGIELVEELNEEIIAQREKAYEYDRQWKAAHHKD